MGFLSSVFGGGEKELPRLDDQSVTARRIEQNRASLETFAAKVKDRLELVPTSDVTYFFIGKPPGTFGIAWVDRDGEEHNLKTMMQKQGLSQQTVVTISESLRTAYENHQGEPRYHATLAGKTVTVIPSDGLAAQIQRIVYGVS